MIAKSLIALAAAATLAGAVSSQAQAKVNVDVHFNAPGIYVGHGYPYYEDAGYFDEDCGWQKVKHKKWKNGHKVIWYTKEWVCY